MFIVPITHRKFGDSSALIRLSPQDRTLNGEPFVDRVLAKREELGWVETNLAELAAFIAYAQAFPAGFLALVDTYDTLQSGVPNYICVAAVLAEMGFKVASHC